jgi:hypothetical protein
MRMLLLSSDTRGDNATLRVSLFVESNKEHKAAAIGQCNPNPHVTNHDLRSDSQPTHTLDYQRIHPALLSNSPYTTSCCM